MNLNDRGSRLSGRTILILFGLALFLLILDSTGNLDRFFGFVRNPIAAAMDWTADRTDAFADVLAGPRDLREAQQEIEQLQAEVDALQRENEELRELAGEHQLLLDLFGRTREQPDFERIAAFVVGRDTSPVFRSLIIDQGLDNGLRVGMPVESSRGLVGIIYRADARSSQVLLISDNISSVPARLGDSRAEGILQGGGLGGSMTMDWIDQEIQVEIGDVVLTSGLGDRYPADITIGRVIEVNKQEAELFQQAIVQPAVDFEALEIVFVITNFEPIDTSIYDQPPES